MPMLQQPALVMIWAQKPSRVALHGSFGIPTYRTRLYGCLRLVVCLVRCSPPPPLALPPSSLTPKGPPTLLAHFRPPFFSRCMQKTQVIAVKVCPLWKLHAICGNRATCQSEGCAFLMLISRPGCTGL